MAKNQNNNPKEDNTEELLLSFFNSQKKKALSLKQVIKKLQLKDKMKANDTLDRLVRQGKIQRLRNGTYQGIKVSESSSVITGKVDFVSRKFAFIISDESETDIKVNSNKLKSALDGDLVKVAVYSQQKGTHPEGEVVEIIERKRDQFVGRLELSDRFAFVVADSRKMHYDIFIPLEKIAKAKNRDKVIVKIIEWPDRDRNPVGVVIEVLGQAGENEVEMHAILAEFGLPYNFPPQVIKEAENISSEILKDEIKKRRDFRNITTFTIDPFDAKDFDDALSIQKLENGNYEIGVHIADVTHYVLEDTILEKEAYERATSVYLVDRVVPMLPEKLSNELCSLRPHEDKLTFSAVFELDSDGKIIEQWFGKTIIHSDRRFTYEEVQEVIEGKEGEFKEEILVLNALAHKLRKERFSKGAITFETIEVKFKLDKDGRPLEVIPKIRKDAHKLIEDFMLLANRKVAEFVHFMKKGKEKNTMVFRIHDHPDPEKLSSLSVFAKRFGHNLLFEDEEKLSSTLNKLVEEVEGKPEQNVLQSLAIRTMAKAKYSTEPEIHFGLAYKHYSHFTSPIRRYPDMMAHRLLEHYLNGGKSADKETFERMCVHSSEREKLAADAERASIKFKQVEFMQGREDKVFDGLVSGVTEFGVYIEIVETKCEGMIRLADLEDDYYELDPKNYRIIGKSNKRMITLGDKVTVKVKKTDLEKRTIDLLFANP